LRVLMRVGMRSCGWFSGIVEMVTRFVRGIDMNHYSR
jgi:hypothetical protein